MYIVDLTLKAIQEEKLDSMKILELQNLAASTEATPYRRRRT
jgi:hypothetical protein